ncbi:gluconate:H+ symporter [Paenibacillus sp. BR2-3]|uniref:GntT/GntP/DsdX family permease n=1 Tax=Paenibacillus sp. BR2-3 TaxID=3048494 RepID=UPI0039772849
MSNVTWMLLVLFASIALIVFLIMKAKLSAFLALTIAGLFLGIASGMPIDKVATSFQAGMGSTLGFLATVLGLGTILGKMLEVSGGAQRMARSLLNLFGEKNAHWAMMIVAFISGIPVFFQVGFVLLIPVIFSIAFQTKMSLVKIGIPVVAGLITVHAMVPPHPAALAITGTLGADVGTVIVYSLLIGLPAVILAGPVFGNFISRFIKLNPPAHLVKSEMIPEEKLPSFGITLFTILLPMIIMVAKTIVELLAPEGAGYLPFVKFVGNPITALLISALFSYFTLGFSRGLKKEDLLSLTDGCFGPVAGILLVIGAGGAFNQVLQDSGMGGILGETLSSLNMSPILLAWIIAIIMRFSVGSTTVAMMTSAGIMLPLLPGMGVDPALICVAIGAGGIGLSHVNDSGFWIVKEYYGMSITDTFRTWTASTTIASLVALLGTLLVGIIV